MKVRDVVQAILSNIPGAPRAQTVDTLKTGDMEWEVTGIVTTFIATMDVLKQAVALGANLVITHEPTFYHGDDETNWLGTDSVYTTKRDFIKQHNIAIWRFHDYWHMHEPDGIIDGMLQVLEWQQYRDPEHEFVLTLPQTTVGDLVADVKERLSIPTVRMVGDPDMPCRRVGLLVGSLPGEIQVQAFLNIPDLDVVICGETVEWQTCEYVRDANLLGKGKAVVAIGHVNSEEYGMKTLVDWLRPKLSGVPVTFVPATDPLTFI